MQATIEAVTVKFSNAGTKRPLASAAGNVKTPQPPSGARKFLVALLSALAARAA